MKIIKSKYIQKMLIRLALVGIVFLSTLAYVLGWLSEGFETIHFVVFLAVLGGEGIFFGGLYLLLQIFNKSYYLVESDSIKLIKNSQVICVFELRHMRNLSYGRFFWALLMQFGAGYLLIDYVGEGIKIKPDFSYPDGTKLYGIAMSPKQVKAVSYIFSRGIQIK